MTSDGGLILVRELDEHLGLSQLIEQHLTDSRRGKSTQLPMADLLRQSAYSRLAGGGLVKHARYYWLLLAKGHLTPRVFGAILRWIWALPFPVR